LWQKALEIQKAMGCQVRLSFLALPRPIKMGATKADFDATVGIHLTAAEEFVTLREPVKEAAEQAAE